jgi:hypothetical protein
MKNAIEIQLVPKDMQIDLIKTPSCYTKRF